MLNKIILFSAAVLFLSASIKAQDCINFGNYTNAYLDDVTMDHVTYPAGTAFITEGDIQLIKPNENTYYQFIDSAENQMCYIGHLGIDVSTAAYECRVLTWQHVAGNNLVVDNDTLNGIFIGSGSDSVYIMPSYSVTVEIISGDYWVTIEGEFDYAEISTSTICIKDICLSPCSSGYSCFDFGNYTNAFLDDVTMDHVTYPAGSAFATQGDIQLIKPNENTYYQFIDSAENQMCYIGHLGIDVSTAPYDCRVLTWQHVAGNNLVVDNDTLNSIFIGTGSDSTYVMPDYTVTVEIISGDYWVMVEGEFDYVELSTSTICIKDICLEPCSSEGSCFNFGNYTNAYMDDVTMDHVTYPAGSAFAVQGDIQLIKPNENTYYQFIDSAANQMCYIGHLGIDVSTAPYNCRVLTWKHVAGNNLVVDNDTLNSIFIGTGSDSVYVMADYTVTVEIISGDYCVTVEGEFDYVELSTSTICIRDLCLEACQGGTMSVPVLATVTPKLSMYPNPATDRLNIVLDANSSERIVIYNMAGSLVREIQVTNDKTEIELNDFQNGMYFIQVQLKNGESITEKFVKQ